MAQDSVQPRYRIVKGIIYKRLYLQNDIFVKGYGFLYFPKNMGRNISKKLSSKYSKKLLDHSKQSATDVPKTSSKRVIQKTDNK